MGRTSAKTWQQAVKNVEHYKAIGHTECYLDLDDGDFPWEFVTKCEPGGSHRIDIATTVRFTAKHPCGLSFDWCFDIEPYEANGKGHYEIDTYGVKKVLKNLKESGNKEAFKIFKDYLAECAKQVKKKGDDYQSYAVRQYQDAEVLRQLAEG